MQEVLLSFIVFSSIWQHHVMEAVVCTISHESKIRVFDTLQQFQGNKIPFSPLNSGWQGSNVEFSFKSINRLEKNAFYSHESSAVISLKLSDKQIKSVDEGAFLSLVCLHQLSLDHNNLTSLSPKIFQDLDKLQKLDLSYNQLETLKDLTFIDLPLLKNLNLSNNRIKSIEILAFMNLTILESLNLEHNMINKIPYDVFKPLSSLTCLSLSWNKLWNIEPEKWGGLKKLQTLELAGNSLNHFDPSYNFSFFELKSLNLSFNLLTVLNVVEIRRHLPKLDMIDFNNNPWFCNDLESIIHELKDSRIKISANNFSSIGVHGVACRETRYFTATTTGASLSTTTRRNYIWVNKDELEWYVEKKIRDNNENLIYSINSLRTFVIFVFVLVCVFILFEVLYRTNIYGFIINRLRGGNELYVDDSNDIENFRLLHR